MRFFYEKIVITIILFLFNITIGKTEIIKEDQNFLMVIGIEKNISKKEVGNESIISGNFNAVLSDNILLKDYVASCEIIGRAYQGRGFSCGFSEMESLKGFCVIKKEEKDIIVMEWFCTTSTGPKGDAVCSGKASIVNGYGVFAGITGNANISIPLVKQMINEKNSLKSLWEAKFYLPERL